MSPHKATLQPPSCPIGIAEPGTRAFTSGVSVRETQAPTRLPQLRFSSIEGQTDLLGTMTKEVCTGLSTFAHPEHPSAKTMTIDPVRAGDLVRRST
jgi:hypothetical protein